MLVSGPVYHFESRQRKWSPDSFKIKFSVSLPIWIVCGEMRSTVFSHILLEKLVSYLCCLL